MNQNRLGCLTPLGVIAALITLLVIAGTAYATGGLMFDPGPLNAQAGTAIQGFTSHADFEQDCARCHPAFWESDHMDDRCVACHTSIRNGDALHANIARTSPQLACRACHPDHRGKDAPLTEFNGASFPHDALGFSLKTHAINYNDAPITCQDCHTSGFAFDPQTCADCHRTAQPAFMVAHTLGFGSDCLACHDGVESLGKTFNHAKTAFALTGKHADLLCTQCHTNARARADFAATPTQCFQCHLKDDPHAGQFGADCAACHAVTGWKPAQFDHNLSGFKLEGKHAAVACETCHANGYKGTPTDCYACHKQDDAHNGQFGTDCAACHNPTGWENATFDHARSNFPLTGAHTTVKCESCHKNGVFKGTSSQCAACHGEPAYHAGMFGGQTCDSCHNTSAWRPAPYNGPHTFPMNHGDARTCADCHQPTLTTWTCYTCHNPGEVQSKHAEEGIANFTDCLSCHPTGQEGEGGGGGDD